MEKLILIAFVVVLGTVVVRMVRYGGVTGMLVGARTEEKLGSIEGQAVDHRRVTLGVRRLDGRQPLGIDFTGRSQYWSGAGAAYQSELQRDDGRAVSHPGA